MTQEEFELAVCKIRSGDKDGLKEIYVAYVKFIYTVIINIVGSKENAEDLTSEVFIKLWDVLEDYRGGNGHKGYLATIARNLAIDFMRKSGREIPVDDEDAPEEEAGENKSPEKEVISRMSVEEALSKLSPGQRDVVERKVLADMTFKEIAFELDIPMGTVTWRYREAMNILRRCGYE